MVTRDYFLGKGEEETAAFIVMGEALTRVLMPDPAAALDVIGEAIVQNEQNGPVAGWSMKDPMGKAAMIARYVFREGAAAGAMANEDPPEGFEEQLMGMIEHAAEGAGDEPEEAGAVDEAVGIGDQLAQRRHQHIARRAHVAFQIQCPHASHPFI